MKHLTSRLAAALLIGLVSAGAAQAQASINDCESIQAADAYNQCLAKFGPSSKVKNLAPEKPGDIKGSSEEAAAGAGRAKGGGGKAVAHRGRRGHGGHAVRRGGGGRKRMTFSVRRHRR